MPEIHWEMTVASATPATPQPKLITNQRSSTTLSAVLISKKPSADRESPMPRRMPDRML